MAKLKAATAVMERPAWPPGDPLGPKEVAEFLGVKRPTVQQWNFRHVLPPPDYSVNGAPAWERRTIAQWARDTGRDEPDHDKTDKDAVKKAKAVKKRVDDVLDS